MYLFVLGFLSGILYTQYQPQLIVLSLWQLFAWPSMALFLLIICHVLQLAKWIRVYFCIIFGLLLGANWTLWHVYQHVESIIPNSLLQQITQIQGIVDSFVVQNAQQAKMVLLTEQIRLKNGRQLPLKRHIQLSWYDKGYDQTLPQIAPGQRWQFNVRLQSPKVHLNPLLADYGYLAFANNMAAYGYVLDGQRKTVDEMPFHAYFFDKSRLKIAHRFDKVLSPYSNNYAGLLKALVIGDQSQISTHDWEVFKRTAVTHVISISGLHISMLALFAAWFAALCWSYSQWLMLRIRRVTFCLIFSLVLASLYAFLAGMSVPVLRSLMMLLVVGVAICLQRTSSPVRVLFIALLAVLVIDVYSVLYAGFWLSFIAVAIITFTFWGREKRAESKIKAFFRLEFAMMLIMMPLVLCFFSGFSLISPLANLFAVPIFSFVITPLALLSACIPLDSLIILANWLCTYLMLFLSWIAMIPSVYVDLARLPNELLVILWIAGIWLMLPKGTPVKIVALMILLVPFLYQVPRPRVGEAQMTVLDVGDDIAVHIATAHHDYLYGTGAQRGNSDFIANTVLLPYFQRKGVHQLSSMIMESNRLDNYKNAQLLFEKLSIKQTIHDLPPAHPILDGKTPELSCDDKVSWQVDGVQFKVILPSFDEARSAQRAENCILSVSNSKISVLLVGKANIFVVRQLKKRLSRIPYDFVIISTGSQFIRQSFLKSQLAKQVLLSNQNMLTKDSGDSYSTSSSGALTILLSRSHAKLWQEKHLHPRYWHLSVD